ncbi:hypothetical protein [Halosaccharopolyspora lacisalsi]|uniref:hypothetical protein n=1 Tax=Halosaccharopolyspora lacisalsi TaxID=1000566 RepID=UPI001C722DAA
MSGVETVAVVLAQPDFPGGESPNGGQGAGFGKSTPVGLLLLIVLLIGVVFLVRSMSKHIRGLPGNFDQGRATAAAPARVKRAEAARQSEQDSERTERDSERSRGSPDHEGSEETDEASSAATKSATTESDAGSAKSESTS